MDVEALLKKLRYKDEYNAIALNVPSNLSKFSELFSESSPLKAEFTILFIRNEEELNSLFKPTMLLAEHDSVFWLAYPKGSSGVKTDINRDIIWDLLKPQGYRPVSMISLDKTWSAMRVRPVPNN
jgi:hypothetical protein